MTKIEDIYKKYFQKSRIFLIPLIIPKEGNKLKPHNTYMCWEGLSTFTDCKFIIIYDNSNDADFINFEKKYLINNKFFIDYKPLPDGKSAYIFDLSSHYDDFASIINGKYSKLSHDTKIKIKYYYGSNTNNYAVIDTYLYPDKYYELYASFLCPDKSDIPEMIKLLKEVSELCSKPNLKSEELKINLKSLNLSLL